MNWPPSLYPPALDVMRFLCCLNASREAAIAYERCQGRPINRFVMKRFYRFVDAMHLLGACELGRSTLYEFYREDLLEDVNDWIRLGETNLNLFAWDASECWFFEMKCIANVLFTLEDWLRKHTDHSIYTNSSSFRDTFESQSVILWSSLVSLENEATIKHDRYAQENLCEWMLDREATVPNLKLGDDVLPQFKLDDEMSLSDALKELAVSTSELFCLSRMDPWTLVRKIPIEFCVTLPDFDPFQKLSEIEALAGFKAKDRANPIPYCQAWERYKESKGDAELNLSFIGWLQGTTELDFHCVPETSESYAPAALATAKPDEKVFVKQTMLDQLRESVSGETPAIADTAIEDETPCVDFVKLSEITYHLGIDRSTSLKFLAALTESEKRRKTPTAPWEIDYNALVKALSDSKFALPPLQNDLKKRPRKKR